VTSASVFIALLIVGCSGADAGLSEHDTTGDVAPAVPEPMIDNALWEAVPEAEDPFYPADDDDIVPCPASEYGPELQGDEVWFSVETIACNYLTVRQPLLVDVSADSLLRVRLWHFTITQSEGTYTHAIAVGDPPATVWDTELPLPVTDSGLLPFELVPFPRALEAGEPVYWHLSNHGQNSWHLIEVSANPGELSP
jgi:hypothetical protein